VLDTLHLHAFHKGDGLLITRTADAVIICNVNSSGKTFKMRVCSGCVHGCSLGPMHPPPQIFSISSHFVLCEAASQTKYFCSPKAKHFPKKNFGLVTPLGVQLRASVLHASLRVRAFVKSFTTTQVLSTNRGSCTKHPACSSQNIFSDIQEYTHNSPCGAETFYLQNVDFL